MDHLPLASGSPPYPEIEWLSSEYLNFDVKEYQSWPNQAKWSFDRPTEGPANTAAFLQTWLYYGTLKECIKIDPAAFVSDFLTTNPQGKIVVNTSSLNELISKAWAPPGTTWKSVDVNNCLNHLHKAFSKLVSLEPQILPPDILLSIGILGATLDQATQWIFSAEPNPRSWNLSDLATQKMSRAGWCPRDINLAKNHLSELTLYTSSHITRHDTVPGALGSNAPTVANHGNCTDWLCQLNQVDDSTYVTKHNKEGCNCAFMGVDLDKVCEILGKGGIPVVSIHPKRHRNGSRYFELEVKEAGPMSNQYIAISHVWSDGLGNTKKNELPGCQIEFLYDLLVDIIWDVADEGLSTFTTKEGIEKLGYNHELEKKIFGYAGTAYKMVRPFAKAGYQSYRYFQGKPVTIWMDTLCIPLERQFRKLAIAGMIDVYPVAAMTVVLDSQLRKLNFKAIENSPWEQLVHIGLSGWMRRAWTFQEAVLSGDKLRIVFADGIYMIPIHEFFTTRGQKTLKNKYFSEKWSYNRNWLEPLPEVPVGSTVLGPVTPIPAGPKPLIRMPQSHKDREAESRKHFDIAKILLRDASLFYNTMIRASYLDYENTKMDEKLVRIIGCWEALRWRTTSKENDKILCFSALTITHIDIPQKWMHDLVGTTAEERMKMWLTSQPIVPSGMIFLPGAKYTELGYRWAPKNFCRESIDQSGSGEWKKRNGKVEVAFKGVTGYTIKRKSVNKELFYLYDKTVKRAVKVQFSWGVIGLPIPTEDMVDSDTGSFGVIFPDSMSKWPLSTGEPRTGAILNNVDGSRPGDFLCLCKLTMLWETPRDREVLEAERVSSNTTVWTLS